MKIGTNLTNLLTSIVVLGGSLFMLQATPTSEQALANCTIWRGESSPYYEGPEECSRSVPWWTSWSNCDITPIHSELFSPAAGMNAGLAHLPWIEINTPTARIAGHQFFGNRPLPVNGVFPDKSVSKMLWQFERPVTGLTLMGENLWDSNDVPVGQDMVGATKSNDDYFDMWPSQLIFPQPGCWELQLTAEDQNGVAVSGKATFLVVS